MMQRYLDIGPGCNPVLGFETLDIVPGEHVTHVGRAENPPFPDGTFDIVHSARTISHLQWFEAEAALCNWVRILKQGGLLEVWAINSYEIMKSLVWLEETGDWIGPKIGAWKEQLTQYDPYKWAVGKLLSYPKEGKHGEHWQHRSLWTPSYLLRVMEECGLTRVRMMEKADARSSCHHWIHFGVCGYKP